MKNWVQVRIKLPVEAADAGNAVASVFDYDVGGANTFAGSGWSATGQPPATHHVADTLISPDYLAIINDPAQSKVVLDSLAASRGRPRASQQHIEAFCAAAVIMEDEDDSLSQITS